MSLLILGLVIATKVSLEILGVTAVVVVVVVVVDIVIAVVVVFVVNFVVVALFVVTDHTIFNCGQ